MQYAVLISLQAPIFWGVLPIHLGVLECQQSVPQTMVTGRHRLEAEWTRKA